MQSSKAESPLRGALLQASSLVTGVAHDAKNTYAGYEYTSSEAMIADAARKCNKCGILIRRLHWTYERLDEFGGTVNSVFEVSHPSSGEVEEHCIPWPAIVGKQRPWDKAIATALTTSWAYWVRDLLAIPRAEDGGMDTRDDSEYTPPATKKRAPAKPKQQPAKPKADTAATIVIMKKAESVEHFMKGITWLDNLHDERTLTLPQFSAILLESYKHGLTLATNDEERDTILESIGRHKEPMGTVNYEAALDAARQLTTPKETNDAVDDHEWPAKVDPDKSGDKEAPPG